MAKNIELDVGDEITVRGNKFILTDVIRELDKPAKVVFKQPVELMMKDVED